MQSISWDWDQRKQLAVVTTSLTPNGTRLGPSIFKVRSERKKFPSFVFPSFRLSIARGRFPIGGLVRRLEHACTWCLDGEVMSSHSDRLVNRPTRPFRHGDQLLSTCISKHCEAVKLSTPKWPAGDGPRGSYWPATPIMHSIGTKQRRRRGFEPSYRWPTCTFPVYMQYLICVTHHSTKVEPG